MHVRTLVLLLSVASMPAFAHGDHERIGRALAAGCTGCHAASLAANNAIPTLAGRRPEYIVQQMRAFQSGARPSTVMQQLAKGYSDEQIELLAEFFARQK